MTISFNINSAISDHILDKTEIDDLKTYLSDLGNDFDNNKDYIRQTLIDVLSNYKMPEEQSAENIVDYLLMNGKNNIDDVINAFIEFIGDDGELKQDDVDNASSTDEHSYTAVSETSSTLISQDQWNNDYKQQWDSGEQLDRFNMLKDLIINQLGISETDFSNWIASVTAEFGNPSFMSSSNLESLLFEDGVLDGSDITGQKEVLTDGKFTALAEDGTIDTEEWEEIAATLNEYSDNPIEQASILGSLLYTLLGSENITASMANNIGEKLLSEHSIEEIPELFSDESGNITSESSLTSIQELYPDDNLMQEVSTEDTINEYGDQSVYLSSWDGTPENLTQLFIDSGIPEGDAEAVASELIKMGVTKEELIGATDEYGNITVFSLTQLIQDKNAQYNDMLSGLMGSYKGLIEQLSEVMSGLSESSSP